jgi:hypothetical protein
MRLPFLSCYSLMCIRCHIKAFEWYVFRKRQACHGTGCCLAERYAAGCVVETWTSPFAAKFFPCLPRRAQFESQHVHSTNFSRDDVFFLALVLRELDFSLGDAALPVRRRPDRSVSSSAAATAVVVAGVEPLTAGASLGVASASSSNTARKRGTDTRSLSLDSAHTVASNYNTHSRHAQLRRVCLSSSPVLRAYDRTALPVTCACRTAPPPLRRRCSTRSCHLIRRRTRTATVARAENSAKVRDQLTRAHAQQTHQLAKRLACAHATNEHTVSRNM